MFVLTLFVSTASFLKPGLKQLSSTDAFLVERFQCYSVSVFACLLACVCLSRSLSAYRTVYDNEAHLSALFNLQKAPEKSPRLLKSLQTPSPPPPPLLLLQKLRTSDYLLKRALLPLLSKHERAHIELRRGNCGEMFW